MKSKKWLMVMLGTIYLSAITVGEIPKNITLDGNNGGKVNGESWNLSSIKDRVHVMFYIDPDEKDTNVVFSKALKEKKYDRTNYGSIAVVNLTATWKPDFIIESLLKSKQEEFPDTIYVKDKNSVLVNKWKLEDDSSEILLFSKDSKLLFYHSGKMSDKNIQEILRLINKNI